MRHLLCFVAMLGLVPTGLADEPGQRIIPGSFAGQLIAFSEDDRFLVTLQADQFTMWDRATGKKQQQIPFKQRLNEPLRSLRIAADGKAFVVIHAATLSVVQIPSGQCRQIPISRDFGEAICLSNDGRSTLFIDDMQRLKRLHLADGRIESIKTDPLISRITEIAIAPDGNGLVLSNRRETQWLEWPSGKRMRTVPIADQQEVFALAFTRSSRHLQAISTAPRSWTVIDATSGHQIETDALLRPLPTQVRFATSDRLVAVTNDLYSKTTRVGIVVHLIDRATGRNRRTISVDGKAMPAIALSNGSRYLAIGTGESCRIIDLWKLPGEFADPDQVTEEMVREQWEHLTVEYHDNIEWSIRAMLRRPELTLRIFEDKILPASEADPHKIRTLLNQLEAERFVTREKADKELRRIGDSAILELRNRYRFSESADLSQRIHQILEQLDQPILSGERLRRYRAVEILERLHTSEAKSLLKKWASGDPAVLLTIEAKQALQRMK